MKTRLVLAILLVLTMLVSSVSMAAVTPTLVDPWTSGDAAFECEQAGGCGDFAYKVDDWDEDYGMDGEYYHAGNTITILNSNGATFDWASEWPVCKVIVKAGNAAYVYAYDGAYGDTGLVAPDGKDISHVTFCFNEPDMCWQAETAWAVGNNYVKKGSWAMYVPYAGEELTVDIRADGGDGVGIIVGAATFSAPVDGMVTISINLTGAIFYYDLADDLEDNNLKVQDYAKAPNKNPAIGNFAWKDMVEVGSTTGSIVVPVNNFYGVHIDVAVPVPCE